MCRVAPDAPLFKQALSGRLAYGIFCISAMQAEGEKPPQPLADRSCSGKFLVRVPPETHRAMVLRAAEQSVSLNRLASAPGE